MATLTETTQNAIMNCNQRFHKNAVFVLEKVLFTKVKTLFHYTLHKPARRYEILYWVAETRCE